MPVSYFTYVSATHTMPYLGNGNSVILNMPQALFFEYSVSWVHSLNWDLLKGSELPHECVICTSCLYITSKGEKTQLYSFSTD